MNENNAGKWNAFFQFNMGHLLIIVGMLGTAFWWFVNYDRDFTVMKETVKSLGHIEEEQNRRMDSMDSNGTRYSQKDVDAISRNAERLNNLEKGDLLIGPRIQRIEDKIDTINDWVAEQKLRNRK